MYLSLSLSLSLSLKPRYFTTYGIGHGTVVGKAILYLHSTEHTHMTRRASSLPLVYTSIRIRGLRSAPPRGPGARAPPGVEGEMGPLILAATIP